MSAERICAVYRVRCAADTVQARAQAIALEQSVELPLAAVTDARVRERIVGRIEAIDPDVGDDDGQGGECWRVSVALAAETTGPEPGQLLNMLFGNTSLQPDVELVDAWLPASVLEAMPGPGVGIEGLRAMVGAHRRALTCTALKPQGLPPQALAELAHTFALAGIDVIKDDHGIADQAYSPFEQRVPLVQQAIERANERTGRRSVYAPSLSGGPMRLAEQLRAAHRSGVRCLLACPMVMGVAVFTELVREHGDFAILAHPALAGASRIAPALLLGRLFRLFGADAVVFPNFGGRFSYSRKTCLAIAACAREALGAHRPAMPVPAGGMRVDRVEEMLDEYGADVMLLIGGHLLEAGASTPQRAREFVERVERAGSP